VNEKDLSRRAILKMAAAIGATGVLSWVSDSPVGADDVAPITGIDSSEEPDKKAVAIATLGDGKHPFVPYRLEPGEKWADYGVIILDDED
jgi:hypothetical protein